MPEVPEWAHVWFWMRFLRDPQDMRSLPQQDWFVEEAMGQSEYEQMHAEWKSAGAPRTSPRLVVAAMAGTADEDEFPF